MLVARHLLPDVVEEYVHLPICIWGDGGLYLVPP